MGYWAIVKGTTVDGIAISDAPLPTDGEWINVTDIDPRPAPGWTYVNGEFNNPPPESPPLKSHLKSDLIEILDDDYIAIVTAAKTDVSVEVWLEKFRMREIHIMDEKFTESINFLVTKNLITQEKANSILQ